MIALSDTSKDSATCMGPQRWRVGWLTHLCECRSTTTSLVLFICDDDLISHSRIVSKWIIVRHSALRSKNCVTIVIKNQAAVMLISL